MCFRCPGARILDKTEGGILYEQCAEQISPSGDKAVVVFAVFLFLFYTAPVPNCVVVAQNRPRPLHLFYLCKCAHTQQLLRKSSPGGFVVVAGLMWQVRRAAHDVARRDPRHRPALGRERLRRRRGQRSEQRLRREREQEGEAPVCVYVHLGSGLGQRRTRSGCNNIM